MLELRALGNAEIETDTTTLTPSQEIVFASALYLVLEKEKRVSRSGLAELLWPSVDESARGHRLRQTLLQLKKLGFPVTADRNHLRLSSHDLRTDVDDIGAESTESNSRRSLEFLPGYSPRFSEPFRDWVDGKRSEVHSKCSRALMGALRRERARADWSAVEATARAVLQLDAFNESAVLALAEATAMRGQKREAVTMLDRFVQEMGSTNTDIRLPATLLRKRILDAQPIPSPRPLGESVFVGRATEMETLTRSLKRARMGRGEACLLLGQPGIGKSRLASELTKFAELQGVRTQSVSCQRANVDRPLSVLADLVPTLREMPGALGCSQETLLALRRLTEFDTRAIEISVATGESRALQHALRQALYDLLDAITDEACLVLVLDDIQWIDRASADILAGMIAWAKTKRLLFILGSRKDETELLDLFVRTNVEIVELKALTDDSAEVLLKSIVGDHAPDLESRLSRWIVDAGEGNPFFLQELAKHWLESGDTNEAPSSVSRVLSERLSRLNSVSLTVLQACTILGQASTVERVEGVLEYSSHELLGAIQELSEAGMLACAEGSSGLPPLTLRSRHDLLSSAVLETMSSASQAFLHRRAGIVLEKELSGERMPTAVLWACAFHWHHAGDRDRALSVVRSCAEHLLEVGLPQDASKALDSALEYCSSDEQRISLLARQVDALQMAGLWERSKELLRTCRQLQARITPSCDRHDTFELMLFDASCRTSLNVLELLPELIVCVDCKEASAEHRVRAGASALKLANGVDGAIMDSIYRQIAPLFDEVGSSEPSRIEAEMVYHSIRGDRAKGLAAARTLVQLARQSGDADRLWRALFNAANSFRLSGADKEAEECLVEAIEYSLKQQMSERACVAMQGMVRLRISRGEITLAREMLKKSRELPVACENVQSATELNVLEARIALEEGNLAAAVNAFSKNRERSLTFSPGRRAAYLAIEIRIRILERADPESLRPLVEELQNAHQKLQGMGFYDFETESLFLGLKALGSVDQGSAIVQEYLAKHRRDHRAPASGLAAVASQLSQDGSTHRSSEVVERKLYSRTELHRPG